MKKSRFRKLSALVIVVAMITALSACGGSEPAPAAPTPGTDAPAPSSGPYYDADATAESVVKESRQLGIGKRI